MTDFSPAAAAVRAAYSQGCYLLMPHCKHQLDGMACPGLAAALRAAADQLFPEPDDWDKDNMSQQGLWLLRLKRDQLLAIAAELEGKQ